MFEALYLTETQLLEEIDVLPASSIERACSILRSIGRAVDTRYRLRDVLALAGLLRRARLSAQEASFAFDAQQGIQDEILNRAIDEAAAKLGDHAKARIELRKSLRKALDEVWQPRSWEL